QFARCGGLHQRFLAHPVRVADGDASCGTRADGGVDGAEGAAALDETNPISLEETLMQSKSNVISVVVGAALLAVVSWLAPQTPGLTRTVVLKNDVSVPGREAVVANVEVAPGAIAGWHTHPGDEISYIIEGEAWLLVAGQPPRKVSAGQAFVVPAGTVHSA